MWVARLGDASVCNRADFSPQGQVDNRYSMARTSASGASASNASRCTRTATPRRREGSPLGRARKPILSSRLGGHWWRVPAQVRCVADASVVLFDEGRGPASTAPRPALLLDLGAGGLADGINSLQADGGTGERLLEHFVSIRGEGSRAPPMWGLLSLSLETSSCVIYTFFQRSGNRERYAVVIRGVICGLS